MMKSVLHIEDDPLWAGLVTDVFAAPSEFQFLGTASTGAEGIARCRSLSPAIVILDLRLPDIDGLSLLDSLVALPQPPLKLLFTARADDAVLSKMHMGHVSGVIWKRREAAGELRQALRALAEGRRYYSTEAEMALRRFQAAPDCYLKILSPAELRVLPFLAKGLSDAEAAAFIGTKLSTVHTHRHNVMAKLQLRSRADLLDWALCHGVFDPPRAAPPCGVLWTEPSQSKRLN